MKTKMPTVNSNVKLITSNRAPTTSNLAKGEMAFGQVAGINSIYGNTGNGIIKIEFTASGEPIIYFANEDALNTFVERDDVPTSGWYAAIADTVYEQYGEWVAFKLEELTTAGSSKTFKMTKISGSSNGDSFYELVDDVDFGPDGTGSEIQFGNYAHTRYLLYLDYSEDSTTNWNLTFNFQNNSSYDVSVRDMDKIGNNIPGHMEVSMDNYTANPQVAVEDNKTMHITASGAVRANLSGYLVVKEILSDGEPWINWNEIIALDSGDEPESTESYVQFDLGSPTPLGNYINSVSFSNRQQVGNYPLGGTWSITSVSGDEYNINLGTGANSGPLKITVDAHIDFFGMPDNNPPEMDINIVNGTITKTNTITGVYDSGARQMKWQGSFTIDSTGNQATRAEQTLGCWASIMRYYENDFPTLQGTIKFEAIDG